MRILLAMVAKDLKLLLRDRMGFFFTFFFPLIMATFFGTLFSGSDEPRGIRITLVDDDRTVESRAFVAQLRAGPEFVLDSSSAEAAREAVQLGRRTAYVRLPAGFGTARRRMFHGSPPEIELGLDPSRRAEAGMIRGVLTQYMTQRMQAMFARPEAVRGQVREGLAAIDTASGVPEARRTSIRRFLGELDRFTASGAADSLRGDRAGGSGDSAGWSPAAFRTVEVARLQRGPRNGHQVSFPQGVIWAILSAAYGFALSLVVERTRGTLVRLRMAPFPRSHILFGKALGCLLTILAVSTTLLLIGWMVFRVVPASVPLLALALVSSAIAFVGIMMVIAVMGGSQRGVSGLGWAIMMVMSMFGGGMVPLFVMPAWMQSASMLSPVRWAILAIEGAIWRGFTLEQMLLPCAVLIGIGVLGFAIGARVFRWTEAQVG